MATKAQKPLPIQQATKMPDTDFERVSEQRRVKDVDAARTIFNRMQVDNNLRFTQIVNVRNQLEGGRPFDPKDLEAQGASWQTNVNFGDAQAARDRTLLPFWKMINDVPHRAAFTVRTKSPQSDKWAVAFAEAYDDFLTDWGSAYQVEFMNFANNYVNFGPGIVHWPDVDSPRFKAANVQRVLWPKNARMAVDEWEVMCMVQDMSPSDLYKKIRTPKEQKRSEYLGWNADAIKAAIVTFNTGVFTPDPRDYTRWQDLMVNNDIAIATPFEPLQLVWLFVRQFTGEIGCYVFTQQGGVKDFLFQKENYVQDFRRVLGAVWYDTGTDSMIHSIKGFGIKNYFFSTLLNRSKSRVVDGSAVAGGIVLQRNDDNVPDESPPIENYGPVMVLPPGFSQLNIYSKITESIGVIEMLEGNSAKNNSLYRDQESAAIASTDTAKQAEILASQQADTTQATSSIFLSQYGENVITEQVRKLGRKGNQDKDAKRWVERLRSAGVPDDIIFNAMDKGDIVVTTGANAGMANPAIRIQAFREGMALSQMPGVNSRWFLENWVANRYGSSAVDKALIPQGTQSAPQQRREALMENQSFGQGQPLPVAPEDAHFEHLQEHLGPLGEIAKLARSGAMPNPEQLTALTIGLEHSAEHMQYLSQDETMKQQFQQVNGPFRNIQSVARGLLTRLANDPQNPTAQPPA